MTLLPLYSIGPLDKMSNHSLSNQPLTLKQKSFIDHLMILNDGTKAAIAAGYTKSRASQQSHDLLQHPAIKRELGKRRTQLAKENKEKLVVALQLIYDAMTTEPTDFIDPKTNRMLPIHQLPQRARNAVEGLEITEKKDKFGNVTVTTKLKQFAKSSAADMAMKVMGGYAPEKVESTNKVILDTDSLYKRGDPNDDPVEDEIRRLEQGDVDG